MSKKPLHIDDLPRAACILFKAGFSFEQIAALLRISLGNVECFIRETL